MSNITYEDIKRVNEGIKTTPIKGKNYAEVPQRIKAFRELFPMGTIRTEMLSNENGVCVFRAEVSDGMGVLAVGHAYEREDSTFINKTSYIENCETSAVGRALGMLGLGIDTSVASAEEVQNAINNQGQDERTATPKQIEFLSSKYKGANLEKLLQSNNISSLEELSISKASELISKIKEAHHE